MKRSQFLRQSLSAALLAASCLLGTLPGSIAVAADTGPRGAPAGPLPRSDPRAQLDPALRDVAPLPMPKGFQSAAPLPPGEGSREVWHVIGTGQTFTSALPAEFRAGGFDLQAQRGPMTDHGYAPRASVSVSSVWDGDDRQLVGVTTSYPWSAQCKVYMTFPDGSRRIGSGTLIGPHTVITAGHCLFSHEHGGWATELIVIPGLDGDYEPFGTARGMDCHSFTGWTEKHNYDYDLGVTTLDQDIGNEAGWMTYSYFPSIKGMIGNLAAYPGDLLRGRQYLSSGVIEEDTGYIGLTHLDWMEGESGGGIYRYLLDTQERAVFAVCSWHDDDWNGGCKITLAKFAAIWAWKYGSN